MSDEPDQDLLAKRLASEVALSALLERALLLQRMLLAGANEPNVASNRLAGDAVSRDNAKPSWMATADYCFGMKVACRYVHGTTTILRVIFQ